MGNCFAMGHVGTREYMDIYVNIEVRRTWVRLETAGCA